MLDLHGDDREDRSFGMLASPKLVGGHCLRGGTSPAHALFGVLRMRIVSPKTNVVLPPTMWPDLSNRGGTTTE